MKTLYLVRHAKSSWDDPAVSDIDRPLNKRGLRDAPFMGALLAGMGEIPDVIVTSTANRAGSTARLLAEAFGLPAPRVVGMRPLYTASPGTILGVVRELDDGFTRAMIVGHNPGVTQAAGEIAPGSVVHMPTCSIAAFELPVESWMEVRAGRGRLRFFETPKQQRI